MESSKYSIRRNIPGSRTRGLGNTDKDSNIEFYGLSQRQKYYNAIIQSSEIYVLKQKILM